MRVALAEAGDGDNWPNTQIVATMFRDLHVRHARMPAHMPGASCIVRARTVGAQTTLDSLGCWTWPRWPTVDFTKHTVPCSSPLSVRAPLSEVELHQETVQLALLNCNTKTRCM